MAAAQADTKVTENTSIGAKMFFDLTNLDAESAGVKTAASGTGVDVPRFYLIANHTFDENWSANLTTDFNYTSATGETQLFVKKAYVQYKVSDAFWVRAGSADLAWVPFEEDLYAYRYFEKVLIDRTSYGTSADWGVHVGGKLSDGMFGYAVSLVEGRGYKNPTRSKTMDVDARISFVPVKGFTAALGLYNGKRGLDVEAPTPTTFHTATRYTALLNYATDKFRVGGSYFTADNWNNVTTAATDKADGYSVWGSVALTPTWSVLARYDNEKPSKDLAPTRKEDYYNIGVSTKPRKGVDLAFAFKHDEVKNSGVTATKFDEVGVWVQVAY
jgi:hypothetical protein